MANGILLPENAISLIRGTTKTLDLTIANQDGLAIDLSGGRVIFSVKQGLTDKNPIIQKTSDTGGGIVISSPRTGKATITIDPADTQNLEIRQYVFDVWVVLPGPKRYAVIPPSILQIEAGVTVIPL